MNFEKTMTALIIGTIVPEDTKKYCFSMGQRTSAADTVQNYMIHGLETIDDVVSVDSIGSARIKIWPKSRIFSLKDSSEKRKKGSVYGLGYYNLPVFAFSLREKAIVGAAKKWARRHSGDSGVTVFIYSMHSPFLKAAKAIRKIIPSAKIVLTVADLPLFMDMRNPVRRLLKKLDWKRIRGLLKYVDKYLLYTKYMAEYLDLRDDRWMVFEGIIDESRAVTEKQEKSAERFALYAGNLDSRYGIDRLIEAFSMLPENEKLYIYGAGFDKSRVDSLVKPLKNVEYMGQVSQDEIFEIMKKAAMLINPRPASLALAKYSCPSKTFEYLASGTPVIMNRLPGLPDEYFQFVRLFSGETAEDYARDIHALFSETDAELADFGLKGANFLRKNKNASVVMKKVYDFVKD